MTRAGLWLGWCLAGCLGGSPPHYDYFVLTPAHPLAEPSARLASTPDAAPPTLGLSQVTIPGYLDRDSIVVRTDDYHLVYSQKDRWAEPLDVAVGRTLRQELAARLATDGITVPPRTSAPTYDVQVDLLRFERHGADHVELWARWTLRADTQLVHSGETRINVAVAGPGSDVAAAALSAAIGRLANDIAKQVKVAAAEAPRATRQAHRSPSTEAPRDRGPAR